MLFITVAASARIAGTAFVAGGGGRVARLEASLELHRAPVRGDVQGGRAVQLVADGRDASARGRRGRQELGCPQLVVQGGELGGRERRAVRVQRPGHRGEQAAGRELTAGRLHRLQVIPDGLLELVDDARRGWRWCSGSGADKITAPAAESEPDGALVCPPNPDAVFALAAMARPPNTITPVTRVGTG